MNHTKLFTYALILSGVLNLQNIVAQNAPAKFGPTPNERQMKYHREPLAGFIHFGMNTFTNKEWGDGTEVPASFNPTNGKANTDQWIRLFKEAGFKRVIVTLKHHDGFCLWPTKLTTHNISASPYLNGNGDLAREISESCDKYGMDMGIYLSPWDIHEKSYGDVSAGDYNDFYAGQLTELLNGDYGRLNPETGKREIVEIWLDGATGSGVEYQTYDFARYVNIVRTLQPNCLTWMSTAATKNYSGPEENFPLDAFWVGNEAGYVNDPVWTKLNVNGNNVNTYTANGNYFCLPEADVSIRSGWFYHDSSNSSVKSLSKLSEIYFSSVGMGIPLLLNVPPNKAGVFHANDSAALMSLGKAVKESFKTNILSSGTTATASATRGNGFEAANVLDTDYDSYWTMADGQTTGSITIDLGTTKEIDIIRVQEYIPLGQRISGWKVETEVFGKWIEYGKGQTIGYQRMIKGQLMPVSKIRFTVTSSLAVPLINSIEAFRSDPSITTKGSQPVGLDVINADQFQTLDALSIAKLKFEVTGMQSGKWPTMAEMRFYKNENGILTEINRSGFTATATSFAQNSTAEAPCPASNTLDGNNATIWQPEWSPSKVSMPQSLSYDFGKQIECTHIGYLPRQTSTGDNVTNFKIYSAPTQADNFSLSLSSGSFANTNELQISKIKNDDWTISRNYGSTGNGVMIYSNKNTAKASFIAESGWFQIIGTKNTTGGIMEVLIDGVRDTLIDTYSSDNLKDVILYTKNGLSTSAHIVELRVTGTKSTASLATIVRLQNVNVLQKDVKGMFQLKDAQIRIDENTGALELEVFRFGSLTEAAEITVVTTPGTGVHGKNYQDITQTLRFEAGEAKKTVSVNILENTFIEGDKDFSVELTNPTNAHIFSGNYKTKVIITDNDSETSVKQLIKSKKNFVIKALNNELLCTGNFSAGDKIEVFDMKATLICKKEISAQSNELRLPLQNLSNGTYLIQIQHNSETETHKIIL